MALRILVHPTEAGDPHNLKMLLQAADGEKVAEFDLQFGLNEPTGLDPGEEASLPVPVPMAGIVLPAPGSYSFELLIDGIHQTSIPFRATLVTEDQAP